MGKTGPETRLVAAMRKAALDKYGDSIVIVKYHGSQFSEAGVSDLLICLNGWFVACEVKAPESYGGSVERAITEGASPKQRAFLERLGRAGGVGFVAASVEDFMATLDRIDRM